MVTTNVPDFNHHKGAKTLRTPRISKLFLFFASLWLRVFVVSSLATLVVTTNGNNGHYGDRECTEKSGAFAEKKPEKRYFFLLWNFYVTSVEKDTILNGVKDGRARKQKTPPSQGTRSRAVPPKLARTGPTFRSDNGIQPGEITGQWRSFLRSRGVFAEARQWRLSARGATLCCHRVLLLVSVNALYLNLRETF